MKTFTKISHPRRRLGLRLQASLVAATVALPLPAISDEGAEMCFPVYRRGKAQPRTPDCEAKAAAAPVDLGNYTCTGSTELIKRFCGGDCEVDALNPVTDPEALPFESGQNPVREDRLTVSMGNKLNCLRGAVSSRGGLLSVNSAWRPQSYQSHLYEILQKWNRLNDLVERRGVAECRQRRDEVDAHKLQHKLGIMVGETSDHTRGEAFDANWSGVDAGVVDSLAKDCSLTRPWPANDPIHFTNTRGRLNARNDSGSIGKVPLRASGRRGAAKWNISVSAQHGFDEFGARYAEYTYLVTNISGEPIRALVVGTRYPWTNDPPILVDSAERLQGASLSQSDGYYGVVEWLEGSKFVRVRWDPLRDDAAVMPGQTASFSVRTRGGALPDLTSTIAALGVKSFKYLDPVLFQMSPSDIYPPTLATSLQVEPAPDRPGWLKVVASNSVTDNQDPYPQVLLNDIDSNQSISEKDVDAQTGTESTVFYLKQANGRTYTVYYKAMDASGNAKSSKSVIYADK